MLILTLHFRRNATRRVEVASIQAAEAYVQAGKDAGHFAFRDEMGQSSRISASRLESWQVRDEEPQTWTNRRCWPRVASDALFEE